MSVLGDVFDSLKAMSLLQLLFAFLACIGYASAQGALLRARGRRLAWAMALISSVGFAIESPQWMYALVLLAVAVAGIGVLAGSVWLLSRSLGDVPRPARMTPDEAEAASTPPQTTTRPSRSFGLTDTV